MNSELVGLGREQLELSILKAIDFLYHSQLTHGEFITYASPDRRMGEESFYDSSPFATSFVVYSIGLVGDPRVQEMIAKALDFLHAEMEGPGLWRYWSSRNERHRLLPPDLDDTCCVSFVLKRNHRTVPSNRAILLANRNRDGLFHTWLLPKSVSPSGRAGEADYAVAPEAALLVSLSGMVDDVDCVANANALLYLGEDEDTKAIVDYLTDIILNGKEDGCSVFYEDSLSFYYMLSRAYCNSAPSLHSVRVAVTDRTLQMQCRDGSFGNELLTALAICTLLNFDRLTPEIHEAVRYVLNAQKEDGSWSRIPMFLGPAPYYGSEDLTTGLCIEALAKYCSAMGAAG